MDLRCLLFCSDEATAAPIRDVLAGMGVEAEHCSEAVVAVDQVSGQPFQIVIIDWDLQPEAGILLTAARERKASERPLTLAIVSEDSLVPKALQAGANSILRKPVVPKQAKDTLKRAHDLLRARQESAANATNAAAHAAAAAAGPVVTTLPGYAAGGENPLRGGEFVVSGGQPGAHYDTESEMQKSMEQASAVEVESLEELEPMASPVRSAPAALAPTVEEPTAEDDNRPRGLEWYLKQRAGTAPAPQAAAAAAPAHAPAKPEMVGFDQTASYDEPEAAHTVEAGSLARAKSARPEAGELHAEPHTEAKGEQKNEAQLFAYIDGGGQPESDTKPRFQLGRGAIGWAVALAACAIVAAPQAPWHRSIQAAWAHGQRSVHAWLNPTLVTTPQAPPSHESFGRAGDEYKLPTVEPIPDATTDPSQIRVTPVVDPTAKKPNNDGAANPNAAAAPADGTAPAATDPFQPPAGQAAPATDNSQVPATAPTTGASSTSAPTGNGSPAVTPAVAAPVGGGNATLAPSSPPPAAAPPATVTYTPTTPPVSATTNSSIPSSLKSQMASMTPDASGNKPPEAAMNSIEPVSVPEATERQLFTDQPAVGYPPNAKGQQGTVILQVLIGRDGTVQDAKFVQGSLAFARAAIDGVRQWKFKPYIMNGRPVSVVTPMTLSFKPGQ
jgi:TonB family protein